MADVRDVHHALDGIAHVAQTLLEHVLHNIAAQVADVGKVIDRRAAGIHFDELRIDGGKELLLDGSGNYRDTS